MATPPTRDSTNVIGERVGAQLIDLFVMFAILVGAGFIFTLLGGLTGAATGSEGGIASLISGIGFLIALVVTLGYGFLLEAFWDGYTVGKKLLGIKVVNEDGTPVDPVSAFIRNIPAFVALSWFAYLVALLSMASSDKRQRLFDRLAHTVVVDETTVEH